MSDAFDFGAFVAGMTPLNEEERRATLHDAVSDEMSNAMGEVGPRIWCVMQEQMQKDMANEIHLNAVINAGLFAIMAWVAVCTPKNDANDEVLRNKILENLNSALASGRDSGAQMAQIASSAGKFKLMEDSLKGVSQTLVANSMIIKGIHTYIEKHGGKE